MEKENKYIFNRNTVTQNMKKDNNLPAENNIKSGIVG